MFKYCVLSMCILAASGFVPAHAADKAKPVTASSIGDDFFFKPYVGADYQFSSYGNEDFGAGIKSDDLIDTRLHGGNVHLGARIHKHVGVELGYAQSQTADGQAVVAITNLGTFSLGETKVKTKAFTADVLGYYPVAPQVELIGTVGVSYTKAEFSASGLNADDKEWKPRVGAGAQYWFTDNLNTRGLVRYQGADFEGTVDNAVVATAGLNYQF